MAAKSPILTIAPKGEVWDLLEGHPASGRFEPSDVRGIADYFIREMVRKQNGEVADFSGWDASRYDRRQLTRQLGELLTAIAS
jgi:hypothetical protein